MFNHIRNKHDVKMIQRGQHVPCISYMYAIEGVPQGTAVAGETFDRFNARLPLGPLDTAVPDVKVFPHQRAVLAKPATNFQHGFGGERMKNRNDGADILRVTGGHISTILAASG